MILENIEFDKSILTLSSNTSKYREYMNGIFDVEFLTDLFVTRRMTAHYICSKLKLRGLNISAGSLINRARKLGIPTPSSSESAKICNPLKEKTCMERYGTKSVYSKGSISYKKRQETILERYGVENVFQLDSVKSKSKISVKQKYGVDNVGELAKQKTKSKPHKIIEWVLEDLNIPFVSDKPGQFRKFNEHLSRYYSPTPDITILDIKLIIEIYGDYYHASPNRFKPNDTLILNWRGGERIAKDVWEFDNIRKRQLESFGYMVMIVWESEISTNLEYIKQNIKELYEHRKNCNNQENRIISTI